MMQGTRFFRTLSKDTDFILQKRWGTGRKEIQIKSSSIPSPFPSICFLVTTYHHHHDGYSPAWTKERLSVENWLDEEHLELAPASLEFVLGRMRDRFAHSFPIAPPWDWRSGEVDVELRSGKDRLARRMGI